jgi:hypothetical protein
VTIVKESKQNAKDQQDFCNPSRYPNGNCQKLKVAMTHSRKTTYKGSKLAELYIARIVCLHRVPKKIVSDRETQFTSKFWEKLHESMDTKLNFTSAYHPQIDG